MRNLLDRRRQGDEGFTLIELLIVIIILGVLAAIVVFSVRGVTNNSELVACETEVRTVETAIEVMYAETNGYPATVQGLIDGGFLREAPAASNITAATAVGATGTLAPAATACP